MEVSHGIHEAHADQRYAKITGFLAMIAGQHPQPSRVDGQRLVQCELGREVRDGPVGELREPALPPGVGRAAHAVELLDGGIV